MNSPKHKSGTQYRYGRRFFLARAGAFIELCSALGMGSLKRNRFEQEMLKKL
jgi:hypothetical protein